MDKTTTGPRDVFMHLAATVALIAVVISLGTLLFTYIDRAFPDLALGVARSDIRWPLSVAVIVFPVFLWLNRTIERELVARPAKRDLKTRKWLLYTTLFAAGIVIVVDLISLLFRFLGGDLTIRFILKVAAVLSIALATVVYYSWNLRATLPAIRHRTMRFFVWAVIAAVSAAIIAGFFVAGSPRLERQRRLDEQRIFHLQSVQSEIASFWQAKQRLPEALTDLQNDITGFRPPVDPETSIAYQYRVTGPTSFELCATFATVSESADSKTRPVALEPYSLEQNWAHASGQTCFSRTIDPDRLPPLPEQR